MIKFDKIANQGVWYLASALSTGGQLNDEELDEFERSQVMASRYEDIEYVGGHLFQLGFTLIEPIASSFNKARLCDITNSYAEWQRRDENLISVSHGILVFEDPSDPTSWQESNGVQQEIAYARNLNKPVYLLTFTPSLDKLVNIETIFEPMKLT